MVCKSCLCFCFLGWWTRILQLVCPICDDCWFIKENRENLNGWTNPITQPIQDAQSCQELPTGSDCIHPAHLTLGLVHVLHPQSVIYQLVHLSMSIEQQLEELENKMRLYDILIAKGQQILNAPFNQKSKKEICTLLEKYLNEHWTTHHPG